MNSQIVNLKGFIKLEQCAEYSNSQIVPKFTATGWYIIAVVEMQLLEWKVFLLSLPVQGISDQQSTCLPLRSKQHSGMEAVLLLRAFLHPPHHSQLCTHCQCWIHFTPNTTTNIYPT